MNDEKLKKVIEILDQVLTAWSDEADSGDGIAEKDYDLFCRAKQLTDLYKTKITDDGVSKDSKRCMYCFGSGVTGKYADGDL